LQLGERVLDTPLYEGRRMSTNHAKWGMAYSPFFRELANEALARSLADLENPALGKHTGRDGKRFTYTLHAAEVVILSVTACEAGINEIAVWFRLGFGGVRPSPIPDDFDSHRLPEKWTMVPRLLTGNEFSRDAQPFQDFSALIGLRHALVHFKWQSEAVPPFMRALQSRDLAIPESGTFWVDAALTDRVAQWAVRVTDQMFAELTRLCGRENDPNWVWR
jgi:hypothetical protein